MKNRKRQPKAEQRASADHRRRVAELRRLDHDYLTATELAELHALAAPKDEP